MNPLAELRTYWLANSTLNTALPTASVYMGLVPPLVDFPYGVVEPISSTPIHNTGKVIIEEFHWQLSMYDTDLNGLTALADIVDQAFDKVAINAATISCERVNRNTMAEAAGAIHTYHVLLEYVWRYPITLP